MDSVTVIIPTHNRAASCARAVESALAQTVSPLEVIVCDGYSSDGTEATIRELARQDSRVRYIRRDWGPLGPGPSRNACVAAARGRWLGFLDDDDAWVPSKLEHQFAAAATEFDLIAANAYRKSGGLYFPDSPPRRMIDRASLLADNPLITSTVLVRRKLVQEVGGFDPARRLHGLEDYDLWLRLSDRGARVVVLGEPLAEYDDTGQFRQSSAALRTQVALARLAVRRCARSPRDAALRHAAAARTVAAAGYGIGTLGERIRARVRS